jgi:acetyl esterase/lipase
MIGTLIKNLFSMIKSPSRMSGRTWGTELLVRSTRELFIVGHERGNEWFRKQIDKGIGPHPAFAQVSANTRTIAGVSCMMLSPKDYQDSETVVLYLHGGGYVLGSAKGHKSVLASLAVETGGLIIAPDYRLAPEHPFPAPQDDCLTVAKAIVKTYPDKKIVIAGDSAGGALAITTTLSLLSVERESPLARLVLLSPWVDPSANTGSINSNEQNDFLVPAFLGQSIGALMQNGDISNPAVDFTEVDLSSLPKTLVQYGGGEIFYDQIVEFNQRLKAQGVDLSEKCYPTQFHVFQMFSATLKDAKQAMAEIGDFIKS